MNTRKKFTRIVFILLFALSAIGISTSAAAATSPVKYDVTITDGAVLTDVCSFPVAVSSTFTITGIDFFDKNGVLTMTLWHFELQDTLTANGNTLVGIPYKYNIQLTWDRDGNVTGWYVSGIFEKIWLPGKSLFIPAGRADMTDNPFGFTLSPDKGNLGNIEGLCAALAP